MQPRADLFTPIHKGVRSLIYDLGRTVQSADVSDPKVLADLLSRLEHDLSMLHEHGRHEDNHILPPLREVDPKAARVFIDDHAEIGRKLDAVRECISSIRAGLGQPDILERGAKLNRALNALTAHYLAHMNREEEEVMPAMWRHFSDEELLGFRAKLMQSIPPEQFSEWLGWMLPSLSEPELVGMLQGVKATAPPVAVQHILSIAERVVDRGRWMAVQARVGV